MQGTDLGSRLPARVADPGPDVFISGGRVTGSARPAPKILRTFAWS
jgi:hypothetical protein